MATDIKYKLADYDGGLESHPVPESAGQLRLVGSWWELHFAHAKQFVNGELTDCVREASPIDKRSCLVSIRDSGSDNHLQPVSNGHLHGNREKRRGVTTPVNQLGDPGLFRVEFTQSVR